MVELHKNPFYLNESQIEWVKNTLADMTLEEKLAQLFIVVGLSDNVEDVLEMYQEYPFGGIMYRPCSAEKLKKCNDALQRAAKIPVLIAANLESGGSGVVTEGTNFGSQMQVAATGDDRQAYHLGEISAREGSSVGVNLAFAPVCDIDRNWRNPITNTRTYGDDTQTILRMCKQYMKGAAEHNVAVSVKHFPGDGCDERDQHLVSSVNDLSCEEWDATYGVIYKELIDQGAQTIMVGHILQPAYSRYFHPAIKEEEILPASCSKELIDNLLRKKLNFNGVVISDAANMLGYCIALKRSELIPASINAGVDMILFGRNVKEDMQYLKNAVDEGIVSRERIDEAVLRVLALKASLDLHRKKTFTDDDFKQIIGCERSKELAKKCAEQSITLVKDTQKLLPVTPETHKRVWLFVCGDKPGFAGGSKCKDWVVAALKREGFDVDLYDPSNATLQEMTVPIEELVKKYDVIMYFVNIINASYQTVARIQWNGIVAQEAPYYTQEIPTMMISLGNPYGFVDAPMIRTIINTYNATETVVETVIDKITGKSPFVGKSPIDPFCGKFGKNI